MLLDEKRKFIFVCVPRTGCRSVEKWLKTHLQPSPLSLRGGFHRTRVPPSRRYQPKKGWKYIAAIRHPLDRFVSFYFVAGLLKDLSENLELQNVEQVRQYREEKTFESFARAVLTKHEKYEHFRYTWAVSSITDFLSRVEHSMTDYLRYENLIEDVRALSFVRQGVTLERIGVSDRLPLVEYYRDPEVLQMVLDWGQADFFAYYYEPTLKAACALRGEPCT